MPPAEHAADAGTGLAHGDMPSGAQAGGGVGDFAGRVVAGEGGAAAFFAEGVAVEVDVGEVGEGFEEIVALVDTVGRFAVELRGGGLVIGGQAFGNQRERHAAPGLHVVPGVGRAAAEVPGSPLGAAIQAQVVVVAMAVGVLGVYVEIRAAVAADCADPLVLADCRIHSEQEAAGVVLGPGGIVVVQPAPGSQQLNPGCCPVAGGQFRRLQALGRERQGAAVVAECCLDALGGRLAQIAAGVDQHAFRRGVHLAGKLVEGHLRTGGIGRGGHRIVGGAAGFQAVHAVRYGGLVAWGGHAVEGHVIANRVDVHVGRIVGQREVDEGQGLRRGQCVERPTDATGGLDDGPAPARRVETGRHQRLHRAAADGRGAEGTDQVALQRRIDLRLIDRAGGEGEIAGQRERADGVARRDHPARRQRRGAQRAAAGQTRAAVHRHRRVGDAAVDDQHAAGHGGGAAVGVVAGQHQQLRAILDQRAAAADHAGVGHGVAMIEQQRAVVEDVAGHTACGATVADLQGAASDHGAADVGRGAAEDQGAGRDRQCAAAGGCASQFPGAGTVLGDVLEVSQGGAVGGVAVAIEGNAVDAAAAAVERAVQDRLGEKPHAVVPRTQHHIAVDLPAGQGDGVVAVAHQHIAVDAAGADGELVIAEPELHGAAVGAADAPGMDHAVVEVIQVQPCTAQAGDGSAVDDAGAASGDGDADVSAADRAGVVDGRAAVGDDAGGLLADDHAAGAVGKGDGTGGENPEPVARGDRAGVADHALGAQDVDAVGVVP
ncbi:hypothetical protein D3C78_449030 [compost metagenome]